MIYLNPAEGGRFTIDGIRDIVSRAIPDIRDNQIWVSDASTRSSFDLPLNAPAGIYFVKPSDGTLLSFKTDLIFSNRIISLLRNKIILN